MCWNPDATLKGGATRLSARAFHGSEQRAQTRGIFPSGTPFNAARDVHGIRLGNSDSLGDILWRETARQNDSAITPRRPRQIPIERAARATVQPPRKSVEQNRIGTMEARKTCRAKSSPHLHGLNHAMRARQRCQFSGRFPAVELHRM